MIEYSQGIAGDGPCILKDGQPMTPEEIVKELNHKAMAFSIMANGLDVISSGFGESKADLENYAEGKLIEVENIGGADGN